jgi:hypothetical protein
MLCSLTALFNVLDYSVACLPVTRVKPEQDRWTGSKGEDGRGSWMVRRELYGKGVYDSVKMEGLPVGVQIVSISFCFSGSSARRIERLGPEPTGHSTVPRGKGVGDYEAVGRGFTRYRGEGRGLEGSGGWESESRVWDEELRLFKCFTTYRCDM